MKQFLIDNLSTILVVLCLIINLIASGIKKPVKVVEPIFEQVLVQLPKLISKAEGLEISGSAKKSFVISAAISLLCDLTDLSYEQIHSKYFIKLDHAIEEILATPQKKEVQ